MNNVAKANEQKTSKKKLNLSNDKAENKNYFISENNIDKINLNIIKELMENPNIKSSELAEKLQIPLSTIQRRKTRIEESILRKSYYFNFFSMGFRTAEVFLNIDNGKVFETGQQILKSFGNHVVKVTARINSTNNLCIELVFKDSVELHGILEKLKSIDNIRNVNFSEIVNTIGDNTNNIIIELLK